MEEKANFFAFFLYRQYELIVAACFDQIFGHLPGGQEFQQFLLRFLSYDDFNMLLEVIISLMTINKAWLLHLPIPNGQTLDPCKRHPHESS
jgi:hypothetical protein